LYGQKQQQQRECLSIEGRTLANRTNRHVFLLLWPWPWPDDLGIQTEHRYSEVVPAHQKELSWSRLSKVKAYRQTGRQTDRHANRCDLKTLPCRIPWRK